MIGIAQRRAILANRSSGADALRAILGGGAGLFLDFLDDSATIAGLSTPANNYSGKASSKLTFTRASTATRFNSAGRIENVASGAPRIDYDPVIRAARGLLIEGSRTNLLLNSDTLSTQSVTVTAAAHTLSFYGTGSITLSGASTGTINGTGAFPAQASSTFTPSAGTLTLTVSGSVTFAQLELGAIPSSYIPTAGVTVTRAAEACSIDASLIPASVTGPYTLFASGVVSRISASETKWAAIASLNNTGFSQSRVLNRNKAVALLNNTVSNVQNTAFVGTAVSGLSDIKIAGRFDLNNINYAINGSLGGSDDTSCAYPTAPNTLTVGNTGNGSTDHWMGWVKQIAVIPAAYNNTQLQAITS